MVHSKIQVHIIFSTSNKLPLILPENESRIHTIVKECFVNQNCNIEALNGGIEHIHIQAIIDFNKSMDEIVLNALTESEQIINKELFKAGAFGWNKEYAAFSISQSLTSKVTEYIDNQKELHKQKSFHKEWDEFLKIHGLV